MTAGKGSVMCILHITLYIAELGCEKASVSYVLYVLVYGVRDEVSFGLLWSPSTCFCAPVVRKG